MIGCGRNAEEDKAMGAVHSFSTAGANKQSTRKRSPSETLTSLSRTAIKLSLTESTLCEEVSRVPICAGRSANYIMDKETSGKHNTAVRSESFYEYWLLNILTSTPFSPPLDRGGGVPVPPLVGGSKRVYNRGPPLGGGT